MFQILSIPILLYLALGLFAAPLLSFRWIGRMDSSAAHGSWGFRLLVLPGLVLLWPLILVRAAQARKEHYEFPIPEKPVSPLGLRRLHGWLIIFLAAILVLILPAALLLRAPDYRDLPPIAPAWIGASEPGGQISGLPVSKALPLSAKLIRHGAGAEVEFDVSSPLASAPLAIYWAAEKGARELPKESVFVGSVWGPAHLRYPLPSAAAGAAGSLYLYDFSNSGALASEIALGGN